MYKPQTFLSIESALLKPVASVGSMLARSAGKKVRRQFLQNGAQAADQALVDLDFSDLRSVVEDSLPVFMRAALILGASQVTGSFKNTSVSDSSVVDAVVESATEIHARIMTDAAKKIIYGAASEILADADMSDLGDEIEKREKLRKDDLADRLNGAVNNGMQLMASISANLTTSRLVTYGFLFEARAKGVTQYQLEAVLDDRTSEVCQRLHGRVFQVEQAFSFTDSVLRVEDPDALKAIAPFLKSNKAALAELETASDEDLQAKGVMVPPFHPGCRTMLVMIGHSHQEDVSYTPVTSPELDYSPAVAAISDSIPPAPIPGWSGVSVEWGGADDSIFFDAVELYLGHKLVGTLDLFQISYPKTYALFLARGL